MSLSSPSSVARAETVTSTAASARWITALLLAGVLIITLGLRLPGFAMPLERDEGAYAYVAWAWLQGDLPYRDAFDHKPPLIFLLYMPPLLWGEPSAWSIRLWATLLMLLSVAVTYLIGRQLWDRGTALLAALLFGIAGSAFDIQGLILNTDQALVLPALLGLWAAIRLRETQRLRYAIATGAALAAALLIKPVAILLGPVALLALRGNRRGAASAIGGMLLGGAIIGLPLAIYFALRDGWADLWFGIVTYNTVYAVESRARWEIGALVDMLAPLLPLLLVAIGGVALLSRPRDDSWQASMTHGRLLLGWTIALGLAAFGCDHIFTTTIRSCRFCVCWPRRASCGCGGSPAKTGAPRGWLAC